MINKQTYADRCFGLPADQIREYGELTPEQVERCRYLFSSDDGHNKKFVYAVKKNGELVPRRERLRSEWSNSL